MYPILTFMLLITVAQATLTPNDYLSQVNGIRTKLDLKKLAWDTTLESAAMQRAKSCKLNHSVSSVAFEELFY
jgi:uncharacterized protein YkwD